MNHVVGVSTKSVRLRIRSVIAVKRTRVFVTDSTPALLAVGK